MAIDAKSLVDLPSESQIAVRLIHVNLDTVHNLQAALDECPSLDALRKTFEALIEDRKTFVGELAAYVHGDRTIPASEEQAIQSSTEGYWRGFRTKLRDHEFERCLLELLAIERCAKDEYENALREANGTHLHACLVTHKERILASQEHIHFILATI